MFTGSFILLHLETGCQNVPLGNLHLGFPGGTVIKNMPANAGKGRDVGSIPGLGRSPGRGHGNTLQYSCLENPHEQKSLAGYSPLGLKDLDMAE